ncbi:ion transporter [Nocardia stercoris]|uniref:ion transporter n=1 Tax=Nocardia stercoris TaxID=2483361 RepID=UPI0011C4328A|nr:ion transporter [Nocardia stercoris]
MELQNPAPNRPARPGAVTPPPKAAAKESAAVRAARTATAIPLWLELLMIVLALVAIVLVSVLLFVPTSKQVHQDLLLLDYAICLVFAAEFLWRWRLYGWSWTFPFVRWFDVLGMIPVTNLYYRAWRLFRIIPVGIRVARAVERAYADRIVVVLFNRFVDAIVGAIKRPVTAAVLDEIAQVMSAGKYAQNIASALDENRAELDAMMLEVIRSDPQLGRVKYLPFHEDIIRGIANASFRVVFQVLADDRIDELIGDVLRENIQQMRRAVEEGIDVTETVDNKLLPGYAPSREFLLSQQRRRADDQTHSG